MKFWTLEILGFIWALPVTVLGVVLVLVSGGPITITRHGGLRLWFMPRYPWWWPKKFNAMCMGFVFFYRHPGLAQGQTMGHENEHNRQCRIFGPFMLIFYPLACFWALAYGKPYRANFFEMCARWKAGQWVEP